MYTLCTVYEIYPNIQNGSLCCLKHFKTMIFGFQYTCMYTSLKNMIFKKKKLNCIKKNDGAFTVVPANISMPTSLIGLKSFFVWGHNTPFLNICLVYLCNLLASCSVYNHDITTPHFTDTGVKSPFM